MRRPRAKVLGHFVPIVLLVIAAVLAEPGRARRTEVVAALCWVGLALLVWRRENHDSERASATSSGTKDDVRPRQPGQR